MVVAELRIAGAAERHATFLGSTIGRKVVAACSGLLLFLFVSVHMLGNTQAYLGAEAFNAYAHLLHSLVHGAGIWVFRAVMLTALVLHLWAVTTLTLADWAARPVKYRSVRLVAATWGSRTMRWTGVALLFFIAYHLAHLTTGQAHPDFDPGDAYHNFVVGFSVPLASALYIAAQLCLGLHLWHGVWSLTQTLGLDHPRYNLARRVFAVAAAVVIVAVNVSYPLAVLAGAIR